MREISSGVVMVGKYLLYNNVVQTYSNNTRGYPARKSKKDMNFALQPYHSSSLVTTPQNLVQYHISLLVVVVHIGNQSSASDLQNNVRLQKKCHQK